jgi:hypothetical protein
MLTGFYPVKKAIFAGHRNLYSSTHLVDDKVDNGDLLIRSLPLPIDPIADASRLGIVLTPGKEIEELKEKERNTDATLLEDYYESRMRNYCDSHILPLTLLLLSEGRFSRDGQENMYFNGHRLRQGLFLS